MRTCKKSGCKETETVDICRFVGAVAYVCEVHNMALDNDDRLRALLNACTECNVQLDAHIQAGDAEAALRAVMSVHDAEAAARKGFWDWLRQAEFPVSAN